MTRCIKNTQLQNKDLGSYLLYANTLFRIIGIKHSIPRRLRYKYSNKLYTYCILKRIK